jgi:hypothetical protein
MKKSQNQRSLGTMIRKGAPKNVGAACVWLLYTFIGIGLSFLVGAGINLLNSGQLNNPSLIKHGELFAVSASLLVGAMRLVSKDDGLEAFSGRQVITILVFGIALSAEAGYILLKLVNDGLLHDRFAYILEDCSVYAIVAVILLVFLITLLDASRLQADETIDEIENDYKNLDSKMGAPQ